MTRTVKGRMRYYTLELIPNLFGEWLLIRRYGSVDTEGQEYTDITGATMKNPVIGLIMHGSEAVGMPIGQEGAHDLAIGVGVIAVIKGGEWINSKTKHPVFKKK